MRKNKQNGAVFPVPDSELRDAYLCVAKARGMWREKFCARTENIEAVKRELGPQYSHIPIDDLRDRIITCCKNPMGHGGGWSGTATENKPVRAKPLSAEYVEAMASERWREYSRKLKEVFGWRCAICNAEGVLDAHHRTYERFGDEDFFDCIPLCKKCHIVADRRRRRQAALTPDDPRPID